MTNVSVIRLLPVEVEEALTAFMAAGKSGCVELHLNAGSIQSVKVTESLRIARP